MRGDLRSVYMENIYIIELVYMFGPKVDFDVVREMYTIICVCFVRALVCVMLGFGLCYVWALVCVMTVL